MPIRSPVVFPLWPIVNGQCGCNNPECKQIGKHPAAKWAELSYGDPVSRPAPNAGYGLKTGAAPKGSDVFVVDLDDDAAAEAFEDLCREGEGWPNTLTVETGRGWHLFFKHPGFRVPNSRSLLSRGIDIKGDGGMVVGAGSPHKSGRTYQWVDESKEPEDAPAWLLEWLREMSARTPQPAPEMGQALASDCTDPEELVYRAELFVRDCQTMPPSVEGAGGDAALFDVVQRGAYDYALPIDLTFEIVKEHYDPRCSPPWGGSLAERVYHKARDAKAHSTRPRREPPPAALAHVFGGPASTSASSAHAIDPGTLLGKLAASAQPSAPEPKKGFSFLSANDLTQPLAPVVYVVKHFGVSCGRPTLLAGYGGLGKTVIAQSLALHMAAGREFCWNTSIVPGRVLHFDYEMTRDPLQRRYQRLAVGHKIDLLECDLSLCTMPEIYLSDERAESALCEASEGAQLAIIDNLAAACATGNVGENEAAMRRYLDTLTRVSSKTGCSFIVLAHERKASKEEASAGIQKVRGSSAITDACGSVISIKGSKETGIITIEQTKSSLRKGGEELSLRLIDWVGNGLEAQPGEDSPGLIVERVNNSERDAQEEAKAKQRENESIEAKAKEIVEALRQAQQSGAKGIMKQALIEPGIVSGDDKKKKAAINRMIARNEIYQWEELRKSWLKAL